MQLEKISGKIPLKVMDEEIKKFDVYILTDKGELVKTNKIQSTRDYNHMMAHLHHYIPFRKYYRNTTWFKSQNIKQKLILMSIPVHEQVEEIAIHNLSDDEFRNRYGISRDKLIYRTRIV